MEENFKASTIMPAIMIIMHFTLYSFAFPLSSPVFSYLCFDLSYLS